jgi:hypothetical protein
VSIAADVVHGVVLLLIIVGWVVLIGCSRWFIASFKELLNPVIITIRLKIGTMVFCVGLWFLRLGARVAALKIKLVFPEVLDFEKMLQGREGVKL